jgi:hypothetical protein
VEVIENTCADVLACPREDTLASLILGTDKVDGPESRSVTTGKPIFSQLQYGKLIRVALIRLDCLVLHAKLSSGPHVRSDKTTNRSVGLLVGRTHLSGTAVSLVGGDPGVSMSHKPPRDV